MKVVDIEVDRRDVMSKYGVNTKSSDIRKKLGFNHAPCIFYTKGRNKASATHNRFSPDPDPNLIFSIRITKPLYW